MNKSVFEKQNDREILLLLKAQRDEYSKAKFRLYLSLSLGIFGTILFLVLTYFINCERIDSLSCFASLVILIIGIVLEYKSSGRRDLAASIQQTIDVKLFRFPGCCQALLPVRVRELLAPYISAKDKDLEEFRNWYEDYSSLSFYEQVFHSQKENIRWDNNLRRNYFMSVIAVYCIIFCSLVLYAIFLDEKVSHFFAIFSWLFPITQFFATHCFGLWIETASLKKLKNEYDSLEGSFASLDSAEQKCLVCHLQNEIFEHRKKAILIPNFFYSCFKKKMQRDENNIAKATRYDS